MRTIEREIVGALIVSSDGKILLGMQDASIGVYANRWIIPGGGVEEGESYLEAIRREVQEETGIDIAPYPAVMLDDTATGESEKTLKTTGERVAVKMRFIDFRVDITDKTAVELGDEPTDELTRIAWVAPDELKNYPLSPPTQAFLEKLGILAAI